MKTKWRYRYEGKTRYDKNLTPFKPVTVTDLQMVIFLKACSNNTKKLQREKLKRLFISSAMSFKQKEDRDNRVQTDTAFD